jgi:heme/copper-type cytochrome/quinol oxidase subunit 2
MRFGEIKDLLFQLITTWQVIAVTVVVILYFFLVSYVAKLHRRARPPGGSKGKKRKAEAVPIGEVAELGESPPSEGIEEEIITEE